MFKKVAVAIVLTGVMLMPAWADSDPFGELDRVTVESLSGRQGEMITVPVLLTNDQPLASFSVPLRYDTSALTFLGVSFAEGRVSSWQNLIVTPENPSSVDGHVLVAAIRFFEEPLAAGTGEIFRLTFSVDPNASVGIDATIDSLFYPPGGELLLVAEENSATYVPGFSAGTITIAEANRPPLVSAISETSILEGDSLRLTFAATDPDGDSLSYVAISKPTGAVFADHGDGSAELLWSPEFVGPSSADASPFAVVVRVSDGRVATQETVAITVVNRNRAPVVTAPDSVSGIAGQTISFAILAVDLDFETVSWSTKDEPTNAQIVGEETLSFFWTPSFVDTGNFTVTIIASDPVGATDTARVVLSIASATVYQLSLDTVSVEIADTTSLALNLTNLVPVSGFVVDASYDPTAIVISDIRFDEGRASSFEYLLSEVDPDGQVGTLRLVGLSNGLESTVTTPVDSGSGALATISIRARNDLTLAGQAVPLRFIVASDTSNVLRDSVGTIVPSDDITLVDGLVLIESIGDIQIGDINLNAIPFEIGDAIYFTNYFISPSEFPFNLLQFANSDVNGDDIVASISDLVSLLNILVSGTRDIGPSAQSRTDTTVVYVSTSYRDGTLQLSTSSDLPLGGILIRLTGPNAGAMDIDLQASQMDMLTMQTDSSLAVLLYSMSGETIASGSLPIVRFTEADGVTLETIDIGRYDAGPIRVERGHGTELPESFRLDQNYPNPFNPTTTIRFALPESGATRLVIYNLLGQSVRTLADEQLSAGEHVVTWDGRDNSGSPVASGVYFYRLETSGRMSETRKMLLVR